MGLLCRSRTPQANPAARLARVASSLHITLTHLPCSSRTIQHCTRLPLHGLLRGPIDSLPLPMINDLQSSKLQACCISLSHTFPAHHAHSSIAECAGAAATSVPALLATSVLTLRLRELVALRPLGRVPGCTTKSAHTIWLSACALAAISPSVVVGQFSALLNATFREYQEILDRVQETRPIWNWTSNLRPIS